MMKKCGIYIIKNKINNKVYIGQSVDIMCRWYAHKNSAKGKSQDSYTKIHTAMNNLGIENFYIEILEECEYSQLNKREKHWINFFDSYNNGYNMTLGGESNRGETNGRAILTEEQVIEIRLAYGNKIPFREVYEKYKNIISKRGLQKVWHYETWKYVLPEVYTDENREWHSTMSKGHIDGNKKLGKNNKERSCTKEEILNFKKLRSKGLSYKKISNIVGRSSSTVRKYCLFQECPSNNKIANSIRVKNIETGLVFDSMTEAARWARTNRDIISRWKNTTHSAGKVQSTDDPAHWITL